MLRRFLLPSVTALGLFAVLAFAAPAHAGPNVRFDLRVGNGPYAGFGYSRGPGYAGYPGYPGRVSRYTPAQLPGPAVPPAPVPLPGPAPLPAPLPVPAPGIGIPQVNHYCVLYRRCAHDAWQEYGSYSCHELAHEVEERLNIRGFQAKVVHH